MFANKVVLITGGSSGIGAATAESFAKEGASISIVGRRETQLNEVAQRCEELGGKVLVVQADVSKEDDIKKIVTQTVDKFGKIDVLVNNAGMLKVATLFDSNLVEVFDEVLATNLRSVVILTHLAVPYLKETKGNIINISSISAKKHNLDGGGPYSMSKAAMDHFTKAAAIELAPSGIRVNSVNPGPVFADIATHVGPLKGLAEATLLNRISEPSEIGDLILYVASDKARGITGSFIVSDNGTLLK